MRPRAGVRRHTAQQVTVLLAAALLSVMRPGPVRAQPAECDFFVPFWSGSTVNVAPDEVTPGGTFSLQWVPETDEQRAAQQQFATDRTWSVWLASSVQDPDRRQIFGPSTPPETDGAYRWPSLQIPADFAATPTNVFLVHGDSPVFGCPLTVVPPPPPPSPTPAPRSATPPTLSPEPSAPPIAEEPQGGLAWPWLVLAALIVGVVVWAAWFFFLKRRREPAEEAVGIPPGPDWSPPEVLLEQQEDQCRCTSIRVYGLDGSNWPQVEVFMAPMPHIRVWFTFEITCGGPAGLYCSGGCTPVSVTWHAPTPGPTPTRMEGAASQAPCGAGAMPTRPRDERGGVPAAGQVWFTSMPPSGDVEITFELWCDGIVRKVTVRFKYECTATGCTVSSVTYSGVDGHKRAARFQPA